MNQSNIRNFCIISHIDHGKSTLADRFLELTKTVKQNKMHPQYLDRMPLERERGITIKLQPVTIKYNLKGEEYILNLIDTPGHVDFSYEVSRSLAAVEGAILLVDARQGVQAQTLANLYLAQKQGLKIIPVINKIDLPNIDLEKRKRELREFLNVQAEEIICVSAKDGTNVEEILKALIKKIPPPQGSSDSPFQALIYDSFFNDYKGVIAFVRVFNGKIEKDKRVRFLATKAEANVLETGIFRPELEEKQSLQAGEIGYIITGLKDIEKCRVGDTVGLVQEKVKPWPGYKEPQPMVFAGLYLQQGQEPDKLRQALVKLKLNDASLIFEPEHSPALGFGFRAGFLGLLHLDIIKERVKREYGLDLIITSPNVMYKVWLIGEKQPQIIHSADEFPDPAQIDKIKEPWVKVSILTPQKYIGAIMEFLNTAPPKTESRVEFKDVEYFGQDQKHPLQTRSILHIQLPLSLLLNDFYDRLKSVSQGYASYSYEFLEYRPANVIKLDILVGGEKVDQLSTLIYRDWAYYSGRKIVASLKDILPRQLFEVKIQAVIGGKILASERLTPLRKDVTAKLYGGDVTRKKKLLEKQKKGKKKMGKLGKVDIPPEAYLAIMKR